MRASNTFCFILLVILVDSFAFARFWMMLIPRETSARATITERTMNSFSTVCHLPEVLITLSYSIRPFMIGEISEMPELASIQRITAAA